jgi:hypothetical protein
MLQGYGHSGAYCFRESSWTAIGADYKFVKKTIHPPLSMENFVYIKAAIEAAIFKKWSL